MKKTYIQPSLEVTLVHTGNHLLAGSGETGSHVYDTEADIGSEGFSRRRYSIWDDDKE